MRASQFTGESGESESGRPTESLCASIRSCHIHSSRTEDVS